LGITEVFIDLIPLHTWNRRFWVAYRLTVLLVEPSNGLKIAVRICHELRDDCELPVRVNRLTRTVEFGRALAIRVEITSVGIALPRITVTGNRILSATVGSFTSLLELSLARMSRKGCRDAVSCCFSSQIGGSLILGRKR
jgi:hypothetical protein